MTGIEGGIKAIENSNLIGKVKIITVDLTSFVKNKLKGEIFATICQQPYKQDRWL